jgi:proton-translocating NADH-quinone oxidoreductase chain N
MSALLILVPLAAVLIMNLPMYKLMSKIAFWIGLILCMLQAVLVIHMPAGFWSTQPDLINRLLLFRPFADNLALVMFLSIAIVGFVSLLVARYTMEDCGKLFNFTNLLLLAMAGMNGLVVSRDLFSLYVFLEVTAVAAFILIAFNNEKDALEGTFKYIVLSAVATAMILSSIGLLMTVTGSVSFKALSSIMESNSGNPVVLLAIALLLGGLFIKSGLVPFHGWLPDAYSSAPSPTSVLLAGIVTKTTGVYALIRVVTKMHLLTHHIQVLIMAVAAVSIVIGAFAALGQSDFKRMLAYSSISQVGYIILGLGIGSPLALAGAVFHLFNHAIFKTLLFVNAAAVEKQTGTRNMDILGGISDKMPITSFTSVIAFLSTAGIPPLSGFWSKLIIIIAAWKAGFHVYALLAILVSLLTLAYFLSMQRRVFFGKLASGFEDLKEGNPWILIPACLLAAITVGIGLCIPWLLNSFLLPIRSIL